MRDRKIHIYIYDYTNFSHKVQSYCTYRGVTVYNIMPAHSSRTRGSLESVHVERVYISHIILENGKKVMKCSRGYDPNTFFLLFYIMLCFFSFFFFWAFMYNNMCVCVYHLLLYHSSRPTDDRGAGQWSSWPLGFFLLFFFFAYRREYIVIVIIIIVICRFHYCRTAGMIDTIIVFTRTKV